MDLPRANGDEAMEVDDSDTASSFYEGSTYTESLRSSLLHSVTENGRGYHKASRSSEHTSFFRPRPANPLNQQPKGQPSFPERRQPLTYVKVQRREVYPS